MHMRHALATVCILVCVPSPAISQSVSEDALRTVKKELQSAVSSGRVVGAAHLVGLKGGLAYLEVAGVCDSETDQPLKADTLVRIYSMTKPITSVAAMTLYEQGKFQLDDPISQYIPAFKDAKVFQKQGDQLKLVAPRRELTVRDAFRHTTGYGYGGNGIPELEQIYQAEGMTYRPPHGMLPPAMTIEEAAEALARIPLLHHPGERFTYGFSTDLLGRLIEVWSGKPLDAYLHEAIFVPLEMVDTGFVVPEQKRDRFASCHVMKDGKVGIADKADMSPFTRGFEFLSGGGGLVSTIGDYANFCQMLVDGGAFKGRQTLKPSTIELMFTDQLEDAAGGFQFGLGFAIAKVSIGNGDSKQDVTQYSWGGYASTDFRIVPEQRMYQIMVRQRVPSAHGFANRLFPIVYGGVQAKPETDAGTGPPR